MLPSTCEEFLIELVSWELHKDPPSRLPLTQAAITCGTRHTWWHPEHKRGWESYVSEDHREWNLSVEDGRRLSRLEQRAEQGSSSPCLRSTQSLFSRHGELGADCTALSNPTHHCRSLVSVTTAGNKTHIQVSNRYNI